MLLNQGDRLIMTDAGHRRMAAAAHHVNASERKPVTGVYVGLAIGWQFLRVRVNGVVGSWCKDSWEKLA